jgi:hypothetical protein
VSGATTRSTRSSHPIVTASPDFIAEWGVPERFGSDVKGRARSNATARGPYRSGRRRVTGQWQMPVRTAGRTSRAD